MTIEELRRARLAAKQEAMGGNAETKRKAEVEAEAEAKAEESLFFDPPVEAAPTKSTLDPSPAEANKPPAEVIATPPPAPASRKAKSHKEDLATFRETTSNPRASATARRSMSPTRPSKGWTSLSAGSVCEAPASRAMSSACFGSISTGTRTASNYGGSSEHMYA